MQWGKQEFDVGQNRNKVDSVFVFSCCIAHCFELVENVISAQLQKYLCYVNRNKGLYTEALAGKNTIRMNGLKIQEFIHRKKLSPPPHEMGFLYLTSYRIHFFEIWYSQPISLQISQFFALHVYSYINFVFAKQATGPRIKI